jgi:oxepin-CoA hydrolase/3-oxo-5,6-dehydrosuberyl-CoA semialdehyde dehydrogenase
VRVAARGDAVYRRPAMKRLRSHLEGSWHEGHGDPIALLNPATEAPVAEVAAAPSLGGALRYAREIGGPAVRELSFTKRGAKLKALGKRLHEAREELIGIAVDNGGNTRGDAKFDIDGAIAVLSGYAALTESLGDRHHIVDGEAVELMKGSKIFAQHVLTPRRGVAIHINAFNFPAWGMIGKLAVAFASGMPVISKPATSSAALAARIAEIVIDEALLPAGAFSLLLGPAGDVLDHVGPADVIAFTGSADTGRSIRTHARVVAQGVAVNVEADSLNAAVIGPDVAPGSELWDRVVRDLATELTQKAGQKCTATRRILVPSERLEDLRQVLAERLREIADKAGDPADTDVRMGPLASAAQLRDARAGVAKLSADARRVHGDPERRTFAGVSEGRGFFLEPILLEADPARALAADASFHHVEVFGPVATLLPYDGTIEQAAHIVALGEGSLVSSVYSDDRTFLAAAVAGLGPWLGRLVLTTEKTAAAAISPGGVFPVVHHGGPGRAGGGSELGGRAGMMLYLQRTTVQAGASPLAKLFG